MQLYLFIYILSWMLLCYRGRVEYLHGLKSLKYCLSGPSPKKFAELYETEYVATKLICEKDLQEIEYC